MTDIKIPDPFRYNPDTGYYEAPEMFDSLWLEAIEWGEGVQSGTHILVEQPDAKIRLNICDFARTLTLALYATLIGHKKEEFRWPATWWDALKERWFPGWLLRKFPVKYTEKQTWYLVPGLSAKKEDYHD